MAAPPPSLLLEFSDFLSLADIPNGGAAMRKWFPGEAFYQCEIFIQVDNPPGNPGVFVFLGSTPLPGISFDLATTLVFLHSAYNASFEVRAA